VDCGSSEILSPLPVILCFLFPCLSLSWLLSVFLSFVISFLLPHHIIFSRVIHSPSQLQPSLSTSLTSLHGPLVKSWLCSRLPLILQSGSLVLPLERFGFFRLLLSDGAHLATVPWLSSGWGWPDEEGGSLSLHYSLYCWLGLPVNSHHVAGQWVR